MHWLELSETGVLPPYMQVGELYYAGIFHIQLSRSVGVFISDAHLYKKLIQTVFYHHHGGGVCLHEVLVAHVRKPLLNIH